MHGGQLGVLRPQRLLVNGGGALESALRRGAVAQAAMQQAQCIQAPGQARIVQAELARFLHRTRQVFQGSVRLAQATEPLG